jgi:hypothetical protein
MNAVINSINAIIDNFSATLLGVFAILWAPLCVAVFLFFVVYALWSSNRKKFFATTKADQR